MTATMEQFVDEGQQSQVAVDAITQDALAIDPEKLEPKCMVCGDTIPPRRARDSRYDTCKPECHIIIKKYRKAVQRARECPSCLHPSTPEERDAYRSWRLSTGKRKGSKSEGRPSTVRVKKLEVALAEAIEELKEVWSDPGTTPALTERLDKAIRRLEKMMPTPDPQPEPVPAL